MNDAAPVLPVAMTDGHAPPVPPAPAPGAPPLPAVAVITTLYLGDRLDFFRESLASLLAQTWPAGLVHIYLHVDGPLTVEHESFLADNADRFHRIVRTPVSRGLARGLNALIELLEDERYVLRMDMDDLAHPERIARQVAWLEDHPDLAMIGCNSFEIDDHGRVVSQRDYPATPEAIRRRIVRGNAVLHPAYCLRREVLTLHGMRYRELYLNEDLGFLFDLLAKGLRPGNLQERLMYWRTSTAFFERRHLKRHLVEFRTYVSGIHRLHGLTPGYIFPVCRLAFRLMPRSFAAMVYRSRVRNGFLRG